MLPLGVTAADKCFVVHKHLKKNIIGQPFAVKQITAAVCSHVLGHPKKPLVLSLHGAPGVGKTETIHRLAEAYYSNEPHLKMKCPGPDCPGYKVSGNQAQLWTLLDVAPDLLGLRLILHIMISVAVLAVLWPDE